MAILQRHTQAKERSLQGASSVELFHRTCDETKDWMEEKINKLETEELGRDLRTVQALQRKHQNLERELAPLEEKMNLVNHLAASYVVFHVFFVLYQFLSLSLIRF